MITKYIPLTPDQIYFKPKVIGVAHATGGIVEPALTTNNANGAIFNLSQNLFPKKDGVSFNYTTWCYIGAAALFGVGVGFGLHYAYKKLQENKQQKAEKRRKENIEKYTGPVREFFEKTQGTSKNTNPGQSEAGLSASSNPPQSI